MEVRACLPWTPSVQRSSVHNRFQVKESREQHQHGDVRALPESRLWFAFGLTGTFMVVEIIGGMVTGSLALISDAMHMLTDAMALLLALVAIRAGRKAADLLRTYGYARFEILAAAVNALVLLGVAFYILYEAYRRLSAPAEISPWA